MNNKTKTPRLLRDSGVTKTEFKCNDISTPAQRQRLLDALHQKPITTIKARAELNILAPAARIWELRHKFGYNIVSPLIKDITPEGHPHYVAQYSLLSDKRRDPHSNGGESK